MSSRSRFSFARSAPHSVVCSLYSTLVTPRFLRHDSITYSSARFIGGQLPRGETRILGSLSALPYLEAASAFLASATSNLYQVCVSLQLRSGSMTWVVGT